MQGRKTQTQTLEVVIKQMAVAVTRCSRHFRYVWANQVYADWLHRPLNEIVDRPILEVLGKNAFKVLLPHFNRVLAGESVYFEQEVNFLAIGLRWISANYTPTLDIKGNVDGWVAVVVDITERKRAEEAVRESETRYRRIVETTNEGVWLLDSTLRNSYVNRQMAEMLGYEPEEMLGRSVFDFYFSEDVENKKKVLTRRRQGLREQIEERLRRRDGSELWVRLAATPVFKADGEFDGALAMVCDITERKRAEAALRDSEERFRLAAHAGRMYAYDWNAGTNEVIRSPEFVEVLGLTKPEPLSDEQFVEGIHPDDRERFLSEIAALTPENPDRHITYRFLAPTGRVIWLRSSGHALFDEAGKMQKIVGMVTDVTEQKLTEDRLREYEKAVEGAEDMIGVVDRQYRFLLANRQYLKMRNMAREQVVGSSIPDVLGKEIFEKVIKPKLDECFLGNVIRYERKFSYPDLGERDILLSYFPIEHVNGTIDRAACILHDITERKRAEETLSKVNQKLIQAHEEERTRIARELHDDICQRIALITARLDDCRHGHHESLSALKCELGQTGEDLQDLGSRVQALSHRLHSSKLEHIGLAVAAAGFCKEFSAQQGAQIDFQSEGIPDELSNEISICLFRVLQEAVQNAAKHSGSRHLQVSLNKRAQTIELTVHDSGIGFELENAFQKPGLGLTSMRERMKMVDGELSIESALQRGTTVYARVPHKSQARPVEAG